MTPTRPNQHDGLDGGRHTSAPDPDLDDNEDAIEAHDSYLSEFDALWDEHTDD